MMLARMKTIPRTRKKTVPRKTKPRHRGSAKAISSAALKPIRDYAHANPGAIQRIADIISERSTERVSRQMVSRWLAEDPDKRVQPTHGYAILLSQALAIAQENDERIKRAAATQNKTK